MSLESRISPADQFNSWRCVQIARGASLLVIVIGLSVLAGWALDFGPLMTVLPGLVSMKPNTAFGFCLSALSLFFFTLPAAGPTRRWARFGPALAGVVIFLAVLTLAEYATGFNAGIDELLFRDHVARGTTGYPPGRMAPITAFNFVFVGLALVLIRLPKRTAWAHLLTGLVTFGSLLAIVGYFFGVVALYKSGNFTAVALHTAISFLTLSIGLLCVTSRFGFMQLVTGPGTSGMLVRRYGLAAIFLPFLFGWLRLQGERSGWYGTEFGESVFAMANIVTFAILVRIGAHSLRTAEHKEAGVRESLRQAHADLELRVSQRTSELAEANASLQQQVLERVRAEHANQQILDHSLDVICTFDAEGRFLQVSRACEAVWGYRPEDLIGRPFLDLVHPDDREKTVAVDASVMDGTPATNFENRYLRRDGSVVSMLWTANWSEVHQTNFCVARDMTTRKQVESQLLQAKDAAEAANRTKSEFLANMSHEIRTPMNGIIGMTDLLFETDLNQEQREFLGMARSSAGALLSLINDILDFSKIDAGKLELETVGFSLRDSIGTMLKPLGMLAEQKGLELTVDIPAEVPDHVIGDPLRLRQIILNLTDNAIKFTDHGDIMLRVAVESKTDDEYCLRFSVTDTGIGIVAEKQELIFDSFAQADGSTTRLHGGTGLGLAIASRLVRCMGGRLWVESALGRGTTFHFTARLPFRNTPAPDVRHADPRQLGGLRVLAVDDNAVNRRILHGMLTSWQMRCAVAASGEEAIEELLRTTRAGTPYSLVILDAMMPEMDGFMAAERIREHPELSSVALMMLTSAMPAGAATRCSELGVTGYLTKPISQPEVLHAILLALGGAAATKPAAKASPIVRSGDALRILLAEDNAVNRAVASAILKKRGHSLVHAVNGREAIAAAASETFDLILMDVQMPEMDGFQATRAIRETEKATGRHTPIVAMTAHTMNGDRERCLASGMDDYLAKPLVKLELFALLARIAGADGSTGMNSGGAANMQPLEFSSSLPELRLRECVGPNS